MAASFVPAVRAWEEPVLAANAQFPFILPMSGKFTWFVIDGMPILARTRRFTERRRAEATKAFLKSLLEAEAGKPEPKPPG